MGKKTKKLPEIGNKTTDITEDLAMEVVENVVGEKKADKETKFFLYHFLGLPAPLSAKLAGYAPSTGYGLVYRFKKNPMLREKLAQIVNVVPDQYRQLCKLRLAKISEIEAKILDEMYKNPQEAMRHPKVLRELKLAAGALDETPERPTIQIQQLQVYQQIVQENLDGNDPLNFMEAIEVKPRQISESQETE